MVQYIIRRLIQSFFLLLGITIVAFFLQRAAPGGPAGFVEDERLGRDYIEQQRREFGLDQPLPVQYGKWLINAAQGDFGRSFVSKRPVIDLIRERLPATLLLTGTGLIIGLLGIPIGMLVAMRRGGIFDNGWRIFTVLGNSVPHWWLGLMILIFSNRTVRWFPLGGLYHTSAPTLLERAHHLFLPAVLTGLTGWLVLSRYMRSEFLDVVNQDYVRTARAKGLKESVVVTRHALRNALIPVITILGGSLAGLLSAGVLIEYTFSWPGLGRLSYESALARDYPVLMALVVITAALVILGNLLADIAYGFVDPRVKY